MNRVLVVRGVMSTDELQVLGLPMAQKYDASDMVALVGRRGTGIVVKGAQPGESIVVECVDADPTLGRCMRAIRRVKEAATNRDDPGNETHIIGMFIYYWPIPGTVQVVADAIEEGNYEAVESAADRYIASGFGDNLAALDMLDGDEHRDAAGHAADATPS